MKNLFIDTNIWLSLYHFTDNDLSQFEKLKSYIGNSINLFLPRQVYDEIVRNRENKLKSALSDFVVKAPNYPAFAKGYDEYEKFQSDMRSLVSRYKAWKRKIDEDIIKQDLPADKTIRAFFDENSLLDCSDVIELAYNRYRIGNPPGKDNKYGDAINWECLLKNVPNNEDLYVISSDKDYRSLIDDKKINPFLEQEWEKKKHGEIKFYTSLVAFLNEHVKDITLETENRKHELIDELKNSRSFQQTHGIIAMLSKLTGWTDAQIEELCKCAEDNDQVGWILKDQDVEAFYNSIMKDIDFSKIVEGPISRVAEELQLVNIERQMEAKEDAEAEMMDALEAYYKH